ncbi:hypothetical protein AB1Y20_007286 [Prymnesium parvum]
MESPPSRASELAPAHAGEASEDADDTPLRMLTKASSVKVELVNWSRGARPTQAALLLLTAGLVWWSLSSSDWLHGRDAAHALVDVGLRRVDVERNGTRAVWAQCAIDGAVCPAALAGTVAFALSSASLLVAALLALSLVLEALDERELLSAVRAALPPALAPDRLAVLPLLGWAVLYCLLFVALLVYSFCAPSDLGGSEARLGAGYGRLRLALLLVLCAGVVHLTLVQRIGEDHAIELLDMLKGHWDGMSLTKKGCQVVLAVALLLELLLWVERAEWGVLVLLYGLWAQHSFSPRHLAAFTCVLGLSICTDLLALVGAAMSAFAKVLASSVLLCKVVAFAGVVAQY